MLLHRVYLLMQHRWIGHVLHLIGRRMMEDMETESLNNAHKNLGSCTYPSLSRLEVPRSQGIALESTRVPTNANSACVMYPKLVASTQQLQTPADSHLESSPRGGPILPLQSVRERGQLYLPKLHIFYSMLCEHGAELTHPRYLFGKRKPTKREESTMVQCPWRFWA